MNTYDIRLLDLRRRIRDAANRMPPQYQNFADANADLELRDVDERLICCESDAERDAVVRGFLGIWGAA